MEREGREKDGVESSTARGSQIGGRSDEPSPEHSGDGSRKGSGEAASSSEKSEEITEEDEALLQEIVAGLPSLSGEVGIQGELGTTGSDIDWDVDAVERMLRLKLDELERRLKQETYPNRQILVDEMQKLLQISQILLQKSERLGRRLQEARQLNERLRTDLQTSKED